MIIFGNPITLLLLLPAVVMFMMKMGHDGHRNLFFDHCQLSYYHNIFNLEVLLWTSSPVWINHRHGKNNVEFCLLYLQA
jgi:hypothetical protein